MLELVVTLYILVSLFIYINVDNSFAQQGRDNIYGILLALLKALIWPITIIEMLLIKKMQEQFEETIKSTIKVPKDLEDKLIEFAKEMEKEFRERKDEIVME